MSQILVLYSTAEGHSAKIADHITALSVEHDFEVFEADMKKLGGQTLPECDAVVLVASVHVGRHARRVARFVRAHRAWLEARPSAFLSVSLSAASKSADSRQAAQEMLDRFLEQEAWQPDLALAVAGALRYSQLGFVMKRILRAKSKTEGGPTDLSQDYEFTDWEALSRELDGFLCAARDLHMAEPVAEPKPINDPTLSA